VDYVLGRGGSVRLVGDDQQLASISAGGVLRDIAEQVGVVTLSELQRFADPAEGAATLALRLDDPAALGFYLDHSRVHVGDETTVTDHTYRAWAADRAAGRDSVMLAPTRDLVAVLNARARTDGLAETDAKPGREVRLADGNQASAGDIIITRCNERGLPISGSDWVKNGDRWTIRAVHHSGALKVTHHGAGATITLPADYVRRNTDLGYASTVHGAQGITADTCHTVASGGEARQLFYVAMTRGRTANHVYLVTAGDGDPHNIIRPETLFPPTATDILAGVLRRDEAQQSATSATRALRDPAALARDAAVRYHDALGFAAEQLLGADRLTALDSTAETVLPGLTGAPAYPTLRAHLALLSVDGTDPVGRLRAAVAARELTTAADPAAVLDWRIDLTTSRDRGGPLPWLPTVPAALRTHPQWGRYLTDRAGRVDVHAAALRADAATWTPTTAPTWAVPLLTRAKPELLEDLAVWRAVNDIPADDRRPTGPPQLTAAAEQYQTGLDHRARHVLTDPAHAATHWAGTVNRIDPRISHDPYWPQLADRLDAADRAGLDVPALLASAAARAHLPDEQPAAALWWRLSRHLAPAATTATHGSGASTLRPDWTPILRDKLGPVRADRVLADPAWPALVAAVTTATRADWTPEQALTAAITSTLTEPAGSASVTDDELATALVWRIAALTEPEPPAAETPFDPHDADLIPPDDLDGLDQPDQPGPTSPASAEAAWADTDLLLPPYTAADAPPDDAPPSDDDTFDAAPTSGHHKAAGDLPAAAAAVLRATPPPDDDAQWAALDEEHHWATAAVPKQRLVDLNRQAAAFYTDRYPDSWAADHLRERLGLARAASTGRLIDQFRDRLVFAIHGDDDAIHGFIARRNPAHDADDDGRAGPKYLNTGQTDLFDKGAQLFGQHEGRAEFAAGAAPVLVEGPVDALAVTLAGNGRHVGVAPLGTAFTDTQADQLKPHIGARHPGVLVATDADIAGWKAAQRAYWQLTARGDSPRHLAMTDGQDPASTLQHHGAAALRAALDAATPLADRLIQGRLEAHPLDYPEDRLAAIRSAAEIIGALPPDQWQRHIDTLQRCVDAAPAAAYLAVIDAGSAWTQDPHGQARRRITAIPDQPPPPAASAKALPASVADIPISTVARWEHLAATISPTLTADPAWAALAASLQTAHDVGHDLSADILTRAGDQDLDPSHPARDLHDRLRHAARGEDSAHPAAPPTAAAHHPPRPRTANTSAATAANSPAEQRSDPHRRWAELATQIDPRLVTDDGWTALAHTLDRAAAGGYDVTDRLPALADASPLPARYPARELQYRLIAAANLDPEPAPTENLIPEPRTPQPSPPPPPAITAKPAPPTLGR
jgi:AAA domain/DNA primase catalytic core, N-terminal domain/Toprim-like